MRKILITGLAAAFTLATALNAAADVMPHG